MHCQRTNVDKGYAARKTSQSRMKYPASRVSLVLPVLALLTGSLVSAGKARAAEDLTVSVLGVEATDGAPDQVATALTDALRQRISSSPGMRLVQGRDLVEVKLVFSCSDEAPPCMTDAAKSMGSSRMIFGSVRKMGTDSFLVALKMLDAERGVIDAWTSEAITRAQSSGPALRAFVHKWVITLTHQPQTGKVHLQGGVVGASVELDGVAAGVIAKDGLTLDGVSPGKHEVLVSKPGYDPVRKALSVESGATEQLSIRMTATKETLVPTRPEPEAPIAQEPEPQAPSNEVTGRGGLRATAWALSLSGVVAAALGVRYSLLVRDTNSKLDPYRRFDCPGTTTRACDASGKQVGELDAAEQAWVKDTWDKGESYATWQYVWYGAAGALLATSVYFFYAGYADEPPRQSANARRSWQLAPAVGPGTVAASASLRF